MKIFFYKILIVSIAAILVFKLTIGKEINQINEKFNYILSSDGRKEAINSIKESLANLGKTQRYSKVLSRLQR